MPKKIFLSIIALVLLTPVFFQLSTYSVSAEEAHATTPVTFFNLVGKVTYKQLGIFKKNADRIAPAEDVKIIVEGFFDDTKKYEVKTDSEGNYALDVPAGLYTVEIDDNSSEKTDFFTPPFRVEKVREDKTRQVNFQGLVFP